MQFVFLSLWYGRFARQLFTLLLVWTIIHLVCCGPKKEGDRTKEAAKGEKRKLDREEEVQDSSKRKKDRGTLNVEAGIARTLQEWEEIPLDTLKKRVCSSTCQPRVLLATWQLGCMPIFNAKV